MRPTRSLRPGYVRSRTDLAAEEPDAVFNAR